MTFAHAIRWGAGTWGLFGGFVVLLIAGIILAAVAITRGLASRRSVHRLLDDRLARGHIWPKEYRERLDVLGPTIHQRRWHLWPAAVALVVLGFVGSVTVAAAGPLSNGGLMDEMMAHMGSMMGGGQPRRSAPEPSEGAREIRVTATEFSFRPRELRVAPGETVNIVFQNDGAIFHTFTIGELDFELRANGGDSIRGAFTTDRAGTYSFMCVLPGHADAGMRGTVEVVRKPG